VKRRACLCCGYKTLKSQPGDFEICKVCFWEDDVIHYIKPDPDYLGGANGVSLNDAKANFAKHGVSDLQFKPHVRSPRPEEMP
jgi:hypothetical protein